MDDVEEMPTEQPFMLALAAIIREHREKGVDLSEIVGDLERAMNTCEQLQLDELGPPPPKIEAVEKIA